MIKVEDYGFKVAARAPQAEKPNLGDWTDAAACKVAVRACNEVLSALLKTKMDLGHTIRNGDLVVCSEPGDTSVNALDFEVLIDKVNPREPSLRVLVTLRSTMLETSSCLWADPTEVGIKHAIVSLMGYITKEDSTTNLVNQWTKCVNQIKAAKSLT